MPKYQVIYADPPWPSMVRLAKGNGRSLHPGGNWGDEVASRRRARHVDIAPVLPAEPVPDMAEEPRLAALIWRQCGITEEIAAAHRRAGGGEEEGL